LKELK
jgi:hypothetical protein